MFNLRHIHAGAAGAALLLLTLAPGAAAAPTCEYDASTRILHVEIGPAETARVGNFLGAIVVQEGEAAFVDCDGPVATVENTDEVEVLDRPGGGNQHLVLLAPTQLVDNSGDEVLVDVDLGTLVDEVTIVGTEGPERIAIGAGGVNRDTTERLPREADIFLRGVTNLAVEGRGGDDVVSANGGAGTGTAASAHMVTLLGGGGNDVLTGGLAGDRIDGGAGGDAMFGQDGYDFLQAAGGGTGDDDRLFTGPDGGLVSYDGAAGPVRVDLAVTSTQDTGAGGRDRVVAAHLRGSAHRDVLRGDAGDNRLDGGEGDDRLEGRGGADGLTGGPGDDAITYVSSPAGVRVSLTTGAGSGGHAEGDFITLPDPLFHEGSERLIGSSYRDELEGDGTANVLTGRRGRDRLSGRGGADRLAARDSRPDEVVCGAGADRVIADAPGVDDIAASCERVAHAVAPAS